MPRQRMTALDIKAVVEELRNTIVGMRLQNVYDLSPRVFLLKFAQSDRKVHVLIESGVRIHTTTFTREKPKIPSQFTLKLRKHVRSWRVDAVDQVGFDRAVDFRFGTGDVAHHFVIEFHSKGNFILTDHSYNILMLLRTHKDNDVNIRVKEQYPIQRAAQFVECTETSLTSALEKAGPSDMLRTAVCGCGTYGVAVVDHVLLSMGLKPTERKSAWGDRIPELVKMLLGAISVTNGWFTAPFRPGGFLLSAPSSTSDQPNSSDPTTSAGPSGTTPQQAASTGGSASGAGLFPTQPALPPSYLDFTPVMLKQFDSVEYTMTHDPSFCSAAEKFFLPSELDRIEHHNVKKEAASLSKKDKCLRDHNRRIEKLRSDEEANRHKAQLLQFHADEVQEAIDLIRMVLATGISWNELRRVLRERQREGHPVANIIHELNLERNTITVLLVDADYNEEYEAEEVDQEDRDEDGEPTQYDQEDESAVVPVAVEVDISISAQANAGKYYDSKKANAKKLEKTVAATDKAVAGAERKGNKVAAKKGPAKKDIVATRSPVWFEKYYWFLTTFGHIVVAARDPSQSDIMVKRYMKPGDIFVHSDAPGASPCLVKNPNKTPIAMGSLEEAGTLAICRSKQWDSKMSISAWWCYASQVSKRLANGDFLHPGLFAIRGKKNFLPAMPMQLGCALLFRTEAEHPSVAVRSGVVENPASSASCSPMSSPVEYIPAEDPSPIVTPSPLPSSNHTPKFPSATPSGSSTPVNPTLLGGMEREHSGEGALNYSAEEGEQSTASATPSPSVAGRKKLSAKERLLAGNHRKSGKSSEGSAVEPNSPGLADSSDTRSFPSEPPSTSQKSGETGSRLSSVASSNRRLQKLQDDLVEELGGGDDSNDADESSMAPSYSKPKKGTAGGGGASQSQHQPGIGMPKSRRQLNKLKKIKKKYGDQDEDDREAAMALIGNKASDLHHMLKPSCGKPISSALKPQSKNYRSEEVDEDEEDPGSGEVAGASRGPTPDVPSTRGPSKGVRFADGESPVSSPQVGSSTPTTAIPSSVSLSPTAAAATAATPLDVVDADHEMIRRRSNQAEGDEERIAERIVAEIQSEVPHLTGVLEQGESPMYCFAVLAPYSALLSYSFKVKVTPGHEKRGNAAKTAMQSFNQQIAAALAHQQAAATPPVTPLSNTSSSSSSGSTSDLKQVFQRLPVEEVTNQFIANAKVHTPEVRMPRPQRVSRANSTGTFADANAPAPNPNNNTSTSSRTKHINPNAPLSLMNI